MVKVWVLPLDPISLLSVGWSKNESWYHKTWKQYNKSPFSKSIFGSPFAEVHLESPFLDFESGHPCGVGRLVKVHFWKSILEVHVWSPLWKSIFRLWKWNFLWYWWTSQSPFSENSIFGNPLWKSFFCILKVDVFVALVDWSKSIFGSTFMKSTLKVHLWILKLGVRVVLLDWSKSIYQFLEVHFESPFLDFQSRTPCGVGGLVKVHFGRFINIESPCYLPRLVDRRGLCSPVWPRVLLRYLPKISRRSLRGDLRKILKYHYSWTLSSYFSGNLQRTCKWTSALTGWPIPFEAVHW